MTAYLNGYSVPTVAKLVGELNEEGFDNEYGKLETEASGTTFLIAIPASYSPNCARRQGSSVPA